MTIDFSTFFQFLGALCGGIGAYVAVRSDLADLKARMNLVERSVDAAHSRVDTILNK